MRDVAAAQPRPYLPESLWAAPPLVVLNHFGGQEELALATVLFQNLFPTINVQTTRLSQCQARPLGDRLSRAGHGAVGSLFREDSVQTRWPPQCQARPSGGLLALSPAVQILLVSRRSVRAQRVVLLSYDKAAQRISFRHYSIAAQPSGVSKSVKALVGRRTLPDMGALQDVSEFLTRSGYGSVRSGTQV